MTKNREEVHFQAEDFQQPRSGRETSLFGSFFVARNQEGRYAGRAFLGDL
jgi:hypothetical protein